GPEGYGRYNLVLVIANIVSMPILLGMDLTSIKYISNAKNRIEKRKYLSNSFWLVLSSSLVVFILGVFFYSKVSIFLNIAPSIMFIAIIFSIVLSFKSLLDSFIKSFDFFKFQSITKIIESIFIITFFMIFFYVFNRVDYQYYIYSLLIGALALCLIYFFKIKKNIVRYDKEKFKDIISYSKATIVMVFIYTTMNYMDKIFVGKFLGARSFGVYSAYLTVSMVFISQGVLMLGNVFLPAINKVGNKKEIIKKIDKLAIIFFVPATLAIFVFSSLVLRFYGKEFQFNHWYVLLFSVLAFLQIPSDFYKNIASSENKSYILMKKMFIYIPFILAILYCVAFSMKDLNGFFYAVVLYSLYSLSFLFISRFSCEMIK
ncbi:MAG: oligosaccharide flippase family protein, partial [Candidatus Moraniibacteriota bacterium]